MTKTCKMCCTEIPEQARKCPHCHHFQDRLSQLFFHPAFVVALVLLPFAGMLYLLANILDKGKDYEAYKDQIHVTDSRIAFGNTKSGATVTVIGTITNTSRVPWKEIRFHVDFLDATNQRIDVEAKEDYNFWLPAEETLSFKLSFRKEFPDESYIKPVVRVVGAKDGRARW